jgi:(4S)-4-hydroxy-5-phosphonooxypentane-2,3-dione isomerase
MKEINIYQAYLLNYFNKENMSAEPIYAVAKWQVKKEQLDFVLVVLTELAKKTRKEKGNLFYKVHQSVDDVNTIVLFEGYIDKDAAEAHRNSEHYQTLVAGKIIPHLESREVVFVSPLDIE